MREKPILFSTPMVQAILDGRKTMTRRVVNRDIVNQFDIDRDGTVCAFVEQATGDGYEPTRPAPYQPGDILWVRETWQTLDSSMAVDCEPDEYCYIYKASENGQTWARETENWKWKPSIFMPKEAARIFLRVTNVRVERVQDITDKDAVAEGCEGVRCDCLHKECGGGMVACTDCMNTGWLEPPKLDFMFLWEDLNAKRGYGWDVNPWVWVYTFEEVQNEKE